MKIIVCSAALLIAAALVSAQETSSYRLTADGKTDSFRRAVRRTADGFEITETQAGGTEERTTLVDAGYRTTSFRFRSDAAKTDYAAVRAGKTIAVTGRLRGRSLKREFAAGDRPWLQALEGALARFAAGTDPSTGPFWFMNADEAELVEMEAARESRETAKIGSAAVDAWKVRVNLSGFAALFWSAAYWFRADDFAYVRYETAGGWGSPKIVIELETEEREKEQ
jgi:hypothetical protein